MCGIAAIAAKPGRCSMQEALRRMVRVMHHRGPDDEGVWLRDTEAGSLGLGNCRLSIQDLSPLGHMPMQNPQTGDVITYNGEIYNAPEIRQELQERGFSFRSHSDTEVILRAYEQWGLGCFERFKGMFALALWDARRRRLLLARDPLGIKPLYYAALPGEGFACASEVRALGASGWVPLVIDRRSLATYLAYGAVQEPLTILRGTLALAPGSWMEVSEAGEITATGTFWDFPELNEGARQRPLDELVEQGRELLKSAVRRHLLSDVPLGVFLSSGLDSTAILGLARDVAPDQLQAFTVCFPDEPGLDENPIACQTAGRLHVVHHSCPVSASQSLEWARQGLERMDQPAMDGLNTYIVSRALRQQGIVVALSGQGGDEVFAGYRSYSSIPRLYNWLKAIEFIHPELRGAFAQLVSLPLNRVRRNKAREMAMTGASLSGLYFQYRRLVSTRDLLGLGIDRSSLDLTSDYLPAEADTDARDPGDAVRLVARLEAAFYLRNTLLRDGDVFGMANSLEIRVPFLDKDVVEWAFSLPGDVLLPPGEPGKFLLRRICRDYYSPQQLRTAKRGFILPFSSWLPGPLHELTRECLNLAVQSAGLNSAAVGELWKAAQREPRSAAWSRVWALVALGFWFRNVEAGSNRDPASETALA